MCQKVSCTLYIVSHGSSSRSASAAEGVRKCNVDACADLRGHALLELLDAVRGAQVVALGPLLGEDLEKHRERVNKTHF